MPDIYLILMSTIKWSSSSSLIVALFSRITRSWSLILANSKYRLNEFNGALSWRITFLYLGEGQCNGCEYVSMVFSWNSTTKNKMLCLLIMWYQQETNVFSSSSALPWNSNVCIMFISVRKKSFYVENTIYARCEVVAMEWLVQEVLNFKCFLPTLYNFLWYVLCFYHYFDHLT